MSNKVQRVVQLFLSLGLVYLLLFAVPQFDLLGFRILVIVVCALMGWEFTVMLGGNRIIGIISGAILPTIATAAAYLDGFAFDGISVLTVCLLLLLVRQALARREVSIRESRGAY